MASNDTHKADQIAYRFYTKLVLVVNQARSTFEQPIQGKGDKWFNLETPESDLFKDTLRLYRSISISNAAPAFELQVLLSVPDPSNNQVLVHLAQDSSRTRIEPTPKYILLESWVIAFTQANSEYMSDVAPSTIYKHGIPLFRSVYTLLRVLPTWKLHRRLRRRMGGGGSVGSFNIQLHLRSEALDGRLLGFDTPFTASAPPLATESHEFPSIPHPMGTLSLSTTYLTRPQFRLDDLESLLSSRFLSLDGGPDFTPTLIKNQQRESFSTSPPSGPPLRTSLPLSPPRHGPSVADRFVLPPPATSRTSFSVGSGGGGLSISPNSRPDPAPLRTRKTSGFDSGAASGISDGSSSRRSAGSTRDEIQLASRFRKESFVSTGGGRDLPSLGSSPGGSPLPIRRPSINPVHPFKASTLSSAAGSSSLHSPSPSLRQHSPLSGPSLPSRPQPQILQTQLGPKSPIQPPSPMRSASSPVTPFGFKNSPPIHPSNLGGMSSERNSLDGPTSAGGKRYSSSFPHRYTTMGGAGSDGSPGSGERREIVERPGSASFLSTNTDDDDISAFVQDIDARKPLRAASVAGYESRRLPKLTLDATPELRDDIGDSSGISGGREPMLTSVSAVDEKLREMNEAFETSLAGLSRRPTAARMRSDSSPSGVRTGSRSAEPEDPCYMMIGGVRPRYGSMGSVRSGVSIASEEVIGKLELEDKRRSKGM